MRLLIILLLFINYLYYHSAFWMLRRQLKRLFKLQNNNYILIAGPVKNGYEVFADEKSKAQSVALSFSVCFLSHFSQQFRLIAY